jgi:hypothetical protein
LISLAFPTTRGAPSFARFAKGWAVWTSIVKLLSRRRFEVPTPCKESKAGASGPRPELQLSGNLHSQLK